MDKKRREYLNGYRLQKTLSYLSSKLIDQWSSRIASSYEGGGKSSWDVSSPSPKFHDNSSLLSSSLGLAKIRSDSVSLEGMPGLLLLLLCITSGLLLLLLCITSGLLLLLLCITSDLLLLLLCITSGLLLLLLCITFSLSIISDVCTFSLKLFIKEQDRKRRGN